EEAREVGPPADVFALGALLYECLAGEPAFKGESVIDVITRVSQGSFVPIGARRGAVPRRLAATIDRALAHAPEERFPDGFALARALAGRGAAWRRAPLLLGALVLLASLGALA